MLRDRDHPRACREPAVTLSQILTKLAADDTRRRISVGDLVEALKDRAIAALILVFALPVVIPLPPGASSVLGAPLLFLTAQLALGLSPWLPRAVTRRSIERVQFAVVIARLAPWLERTERLLRPRLAFLTGAPAERLIGGICLILACILFLPIPMGNMPPAAAICMFALAILERDGLWVIGACAVSAAAIALVWGILFALIASGSHLIARIFG